MLASPQGYQIFLGSRHSDDFPNSISNILSESDVVLCEGYYRSVMPKVVIESSTDDEKTTSEPGAPVILRAHLHKDTRGILGLSPADLDSVISYISQHQAPSGIVEK